MFVHVRNAFTKGIVWYYYILPGPLDQVHLGLHAHPIANLDIHDNDPRIWIIVNKEKHG